MPLPLPTHSEGEVEDIRVSRLEHEAGICNMLFTAFRRVCNHASKGAILAVTVVFCLAIFSTRQCNLGHMWRHRAFEDHGGTDRFFAISVRKAENKSGPIFQAKKLNMLTVGQQPHGHEVNSRRVGFPEWEVVGPKALIRSEMHATAPVVGNRQKGAILIGHVEGNWLALSDGDPGWVMIDNGGVVLSKRHALYTHISSGTCEAQGMFPINSTSVCRAAAKVLGFSLTPAAVSLRGKARLDECYVMRSVDEWMAANGITKSRPQGMEYLSQESIAAFELQSGMDTLCSSKAYPPAFNDYLDSAMVAKRIRQVDWSLADSRSLCPAPKLQCQVLWPLSPKDLTHLGFGHAILQFEPLRAYVEYSGCKWVVSEALAADWQTWGLGPFWSVTLPEQQWQARWNVAPMCGFQLPVKCEAPFNFLSQAGWDQFVTGPAFNGPGPPSGVYTAAYDLFLQTFGPRLAQYRTPFNGRYAAIHVSGKEGMPAKQLVDLVHSWWPSMDRIFVATSDMAVMSDLKSSVGIGAELAWTRSLKGWAQKVTMEQSGIRRSDSADIEIAAFLDDIAGLAGASVIVGTCTSEFFSVARSLNLHLHLRVARSHPWCYDVQTRKTCD